MSVCAVMHKVGSKSLHRRQGLTVPVAHHRICLAVCLKITQLQRHSQECDLLPFSTCSINRMKNVPNCSRLMLTSNITTVLAVYNGITVALRYTHLAAQFPNPVAMSCHVMYFTANTETKPHSKGISNRRCFPSYTK